MFETLLYHHRNIYILEACALLKWSWNSFCMPLCPLGSLLPFFLCWHSRAADSQPTSGSAAFLPTQSLMHYLDESFSLYHWLVCFNILCVINIFLQGIPSLHFIRLFDLSQMKCFLSFFLSFVLSLRSVLQLRLRWQLLMEARWLQKGMGQLRKSA